MMDGRGCALSVVRCGGGCGGGSAWTRGGTGTNKKGGRDATPTALAMTMLVQHRGHPKLPKQGGRAASDDFDRCSHRLAGYPWTDGRCREALRRFAAHTLNLAPQHSVRMPPWPYLSGQTPSPTCLADRSHHAAYVEAATSNTASSIAHHSSSSSSSMMSVDSRRTALLRCRRHA